MPAISLIELYKDGRASVLVRNTKKDVTRLFATCGLVVFLDNGEIGVKTEQAVRELRGNPQSAVQIPLDIATETKFLQSRIRILHPNFGNPCNCLEIIEEILDADNTIIDNYRDLYEYTERLRAAFEEREEFVCNEHLKAQIIGTIPHMTFYGQPYLDRIHAIQLEEGQAFVAYEYFDEDDGTYHIHTLGDTSEFVTEFPAYDLARALLQYGLVDARDALDPLNYKAVGLFN